MRAHGVVIVNRSVTATVLACCLLLASVPARAQVTTSDLQIAGRALGFLEKPMSGDIVVGIVYAADNAQSRREAENLQRLLGSGLKVGNVTLQPSLVSTADVARSNVRLFFLTPGLGGQASVVAAASRARSVPCITTDIAQVREGLCAMGVRSRPKIEILVNRTAAKDSSTAFSTVFRMMITEI